MRHQEAATGVVYECHLRAALLRAAKVTEAHAAVCAQQQVVRLDVAMSHAHGVHVVDALQM